MKNLFFFLLLSSFTLCLTSCEKAETEQAQESEHAKHERLGFRAPDCSECDPEHCCCFVELTNGATSADLAFCGTTNPDISTNVCGPITLQSPCDPINGFYWIEPLDNMNNPDEFFCVEKGTSFMIGVGSAAGTSVRFTCQYGLTNPQYITLNLTAGEKRYYTVDNECELDECHL